MNVKITVGRSKAERLTDEEPRADWRLVPTEDREELFQIFQQGFLTLDHAKSLNMPLPTLERHLRDWRVDRLRIIDVPPTWFPDSPSRLYNDQVVVQTDDAVIISDIEIPDHDPVMLEAALLTAIAHNIKTLIIDGDYLATDNQALNSWAETWAEGDDINYEGAIGIAVRILERFIAWFDRIVVVEGNHDDRINRKTGGEVWFAMLLREAQMRANDFGCALEFTHYSYCYLETRRGMVLVDHPVNYSVNPTGLAQQLYMVENGPYYDPHDPNSRVDRCHIVIAHTHIQGWIMSKDGTRECHALGTMRDPMRTKYLKKHKGKLPQWVQGFLRISGGYFYPLNRHTTDWGEELAGLEDCHAEILVSQRG